MLNRQSIHSVLACRDMLVWLCKQSVLLPPGSPSLLNVPRPRAMTGFHMKCLSEALGVPVTVHGMAWVSPLTFGLGCVPSPLSALDVNIITVYDGMHWGLLYCNTAVAGPSRRVIPWHALGDWSGSQSGLYCTGPIMPITQ